MTPSATHTTVKVTAARTARWVAGTAAAVLLFAVAGPAQAATAAPVTSRFRVAAVPATVHVHAVETVSGAVSPRVAGVPVLLQRLVAGRWQTVAHQQTTKYGRYTFHVKTPGKPALWSLRVARAATVTTRAGTSHTVHVRVTAAVYRVGLAAEAPKVLAGTAVNLAGTVSPTATGGVVVQVLRAGAWRTVGTAKLVRSVFTFTRMLPAGRYPLRALKGYGATVAAGQSAPVVVTVVPLPPTPAPTAAAAKLTVSSPDDAVLALPGSRLVFSAVRKGAPPAPKAFTFTNTGTGTLTVSGLSVTGFDAGSFSLAPGQPTTLSIPPGGAAMVSVAFNPSAPTNCPTAANPFPVSGDNRDATLSFASNDPAQPVADVPVAGVISCDNGGANEPTWDQVAHALGYTDVVVPAGAPDSARRNLSYKINPGTDEIVAPYFTAANPALPVSLTPLAHYASAETVPYQATGWYAKGAVMTPRDFCTAACQQLWQFPADFSLSSFNQNEKLLPQQTGGTTFTPAGAFGLFSGDGSDVNFTDDAMNIAHDATNADLVPKTTLHDMRVYPAYGPGHVAIPNTYLIAVDITRVPSEKNLDYQDVVMVLRNATPAS